MIDQLQNLLADAEAAIELDPENEALVGQRTFFENQLERTQLNASFVQDRLRPRVANGDVCYLQRLVFTVDDALWDDELYFWKNAMGMRVTREVFDPASSSPSSEREVNRSKQQQHTRPTSVVLAFGQEFLDADDGGKAAVELRRRPEGAPRARVGNGLSYVSLNVPYGVRVSRIYESGGELVYGFGYFDVRSPSGYAVRASVAARRDPVEYVALNVPNVAEAEAWYVDRFGMVGGIPPDANGFAPKSPPGSRLLTCGGEAKQTAGILLQPLQAAADAGEALDVGEVFAGAVFVAGGKRGERIGDATERGADAFGFPSETVGYEAFTREAKAGAAAVPMKYALPPPVVSPQE